jgi:hypothetical protein
VSLYREAGRARRRRRLIAGAVVAGLAAVALVVVLLAGGGEPTPADRASAARDAAGQALDRLELLEIEYPQAARTPTELAGAQGHIDAALAVVASHRRDLQAVDPGALAEVERALRAVRAGVAARIPPAELGRRITTARRALGAFA